MSVSWHIFAHGAMPGLSPLCAPKAGRPIGPPPRVKDFTTTAADDEGDGPSAGDDELKTLGRGPASWD